MSTRRAQKSEVHKVTEDARSSPASRAARSSRRSPRAAGAGGGATRPTTPLPPAAPANRPAAPERDGPGTIGAGPGAGDASSGGGAGAGIPGGGTDMRIGDKIRRGTVEEDRKRLFPDAPAPSSRRRSSRSSHPPDPSDFGGPLDLDRPDVTR